MPSRDGRSGGQAQRASGWRRPASPKPRGSAVNTTDERRTVRAFGGTYADPVAPVARALPLRRLVIVVAVVLASSAGGEGAPGSVSTSSWTNAAIPFSVEQAPGAMPIFVLGPNRFTPFQLSRFVLGVDAFLARAQGGARGGQVVFRIDGLRGYIALATSPFVDGPAYLLTLRGEPVRSFQDDAALLSAVSRLGDRLLASWPRAIQGTGGSPGRESSGSHPMFLIP